MEKPGVKSPNFESLARTYRFQCLGEACKVNDLNTLLLAHHQDDQAETVFMRMISGHGVQGLTGMKEDTEIPECYGIHGIHESGGNGNTIEGRNQPDPNLTINAEWKGRQLPIEQGGIKLYRPLLGFSKARLIATCEEAKIGWFEDHTNKDPTITMRNAVRHLYTSYAMPPALTKPALLELSQRCRDTIASRLATMKSWLSKCTISQFETRVGCVEVTFLELNDVERTASLSEQQLVASELLRKVIMLVTPDEHVGISSLNGAVLRIFPRLSSKIEEEQKQTSFTVAGVLFNPLPKLGPNSWHISRQPYSSNVDTQPAMEFAPRKDMTIPTTWRLYDGRFWIRLSKPTTHTVVIRPFREENMKMLLSGLDPLERERLQDYLKKKVPGNVRWTLPCLFLGKRPVALPTLGFRISDAKWAECEVRYKKINLENLPFAGKILP